MKLKNCVVGTKVRVKAYDKQDRNTLRSYHRSCGEVFIIESVDSDGDVRLHTDDNSDTDYVHHTNLKRIKD